LDSGCSLELALMNQVVLNENPASAPEGVQV
jgi:hypothetical protein